MVFDLICRGRSLFPHFISCSHVSGFAGPALQTEWPGLSHIRFREADCQGPDTSRSPVSPILESLRHPQDAHLKAYIGRRVEGALIS